MSQYLQSAWVPIAQQNRESGSVDSSVAQIESEGLTVPPRGMKFVMRTTTHHPQRHLGQQSHEASEDETDVSTSKGILQLYPEVSYLCTKNAVLLQQIKELEEARNTFASSIPMKSDDTWRHQVKTYVATILFAQVKLIPSQKFLDDLANPFSLGNKTAHHFKVGNKLSSFWMTYKQDVAFGIKQKRGNVQECITKDFKSKCSIAAHYC